MQLASKKQVIFKRGIFTLFLILLSFFAFTCQVEAVNQTNQAQQGLDFVASGSVKTGNEARSAQEIAGLVINAILGASAIIFVSMAIFGGITWLTAGGNEEKVKKSQRTLGHATIGLAILIIAFLVTNFIIIRTIEVINPVINNSTQ